MSSFISTGLPQENKIASIVASSQSYNIYPCLFLKLNTQIDSGAGTKENTYKLK